MNQSSAFPGPNTCFKRLRFGGTCSTCGTQVDPEAWGWHDPDAKKILCSDCRGAPCSIAESKSHERALPVGGTSALAWSNSGNRRNRRKGAAGEFLMDACLHRELQDGEVILNDRRIPGGGGNVDHIVVARSGVWIIDTKHWDGKIEYRGAKGLFDVDERLFVGGKDHTYLTDDLYAEAIPIATVLNDRSIPIHLAIVFVNGNWGSTMRLLSRQPYNHNRVFIAWPKALVSKIKAGGQLNPEQVESIGSQLDRELVPM